MLLYFDISAVNSLFYCLSPATYRISLRRCFIARTRPLSTVNKGLLLLKITHIVANFKLKMMRQTHVLTRRDVTSRCIKPRPLLMNPVHYFSELARIVTLSDES
jgi:hypothetical protein